MPPKRRPVSTNRCNHVKFIESVNLIIVLLTNPKSMSMSTLMSMSKCQHNVNNVTLTCLSSRARYRAKAGGDKAHMQTMLTMFSSIAKPQADTLLMFTGRNQNISAYMKGELTKHRPKLQVTLPPAARSCYPFSRLLPHQFRTSSKSPFNPGPTFPHLPPGRLSPQGHMLRPSFTYSSAIRLV